MDSDAALLLDTVHFAADKHRNQRRKDPDGTPYINHPIGTCFLMMPLKVAIKITITIMLIIINGRQVRLIFHIITDIYKRLFVPALTFINCCLVE